MKSTNKNQQALLILMLYTNTIFPQEHLIEKKISLSFLENEELKYIDKAVDLFYVDNNKEAAYQLSHQLLKQLKTDASKSRLTHLISCYFLELKRDLDSAAYYSKKTLNYKNFSNDSIMRMRNLLGNMSLVNTLLSKGLYKEAKKVSIEGQEKAYNWGGLLKSLIGLCCI